MLTCKMFKKTFAFTWNASLKRPLAQSDPEIFKEIMNQKQRQIEGINLIASENYCSNACFAAVGSVLNNKYAEGYPGARYYGGTQFVDNIERICQQRALNLFKLDPLQWGVNVQSYSGSPANFAVYTAMLNAHDRILSLDLTHGGHLSHGFQSMGKKISATAKFFQIYPYHLNELTGHINYDELYNTARIYRPKLIIAGASAYSRLLDYKKFRQICDEIGAYLLADMSHPAGLMAAGIIQSPFAYADFVTTTTNKTSRGPRGSLIYYKVGSTKDKKGNEIKYDYKQRIDSAVFPGLQGGPHMHNIAGIAVGLKQELSAQFVQYQKQVVKNIQTACKKVIDDGYHVVSGGTDNHLFLLDMRSKRLDGARIQTVCNQIGISINKNTVPGDKSALVPSGIRIGSPAMTTRGCMQQDFIQMINFLNRATGIAQKVSLQTKGTKLKDFKDVLSQGKFNQDLSKLKQQIVQFASQFSVPGGLY